MSFVIMYGNKKNIVPLYQKKINEVFDNHIFMDWH